MNDIFPKKALIAPALIIAALVLGANPSSNAPDTVASTLQNDGSGAIVMAGTSSPRHIYKPRISYKTAKKLGFIK